MLSGAPETLPQGLCSVRRGCGGEDLCSLMPPWLGGKSPLTGSVNIRATGEAPITRTFSEGRPCSPPGQLLLLCLYSLRPLMGKRGAIYRVPRDPSIFAHTSREDHCSTPASELFPCPAEGQTSQIHCA